jgi:hypothetical protein
MKAFAKRSDIFPNPSSIRAHILLKIPGTAWFTLSRLFLVARLMTESKIECESIREASKEAMKYAPPVETAFSCKELTVPAVGSLPSGESISTKGIVRSLARSCKKINKARGCRVEIEAS